MRISCLELDDFIANIDNAIKNGCRCLGNRIYVQNTKQPLNVDKTSFQITIQASTVIGLSDEGEALLEYGEECGVDRHSSPISREGSARREELRARLEVWAKMNGVSILPGVLDM